MPGGRHKTGFRGPSPDVGKATQFRPGISGNPSGGPKTGSLAQAYLRVLAEHVPFVPSTAPMPRR
jgi:hypothetical protein